MKVELNKRSLLFTIHNDQEKDLLVADDFCFDSKSQHILLDESDLKVRKDNFSNGIARMQGRMAKLKSHGERTCEIAYFDNAEKNATTKSTVLIVWHTNLFVGDLQGNYASKRFTGIIPASLPIGDNSLESKPELDELSLSSYKLRKSLGIIEN